MCQTALLARFCFLIDFVRFRAAAMLFFGSHGLHLVNFAVYFRVLFTNCIGILVSIIGY